ncbi:MAG: hypothetical protein WC247_03510 [Porticoccaceae bacterium]|jgi:uncharacterized low-complexity protein
MTKQLTKSLVAAAGVALLASATAAPEVSAGENPFRMVELASGYQMADAGGDKDAEGKCGEGKCGEGMCGAAMDAGDEADGDGETAAKAGAEGKCGEGKCGAMGADE